MAAQHRMMVRAQGSGMRNTRVRSGSLRPTATNATSEGSDLDAKRFSRSGRVRLRLVAPEHEKSKHSRPDPTRGRSDDLVSERQSPGGGDSAVVGPRVER